MALSWRHKDLDLDYGSSDWSDPGVALSEIDDDAFARAIREGRTQREHRRPVTSR
jgi:hypothetical protein